MKTINEYLLSKKGAKLHKDELYNCFGNNLLKYIDDIYNFEGGKIIEFNTIKYRTFDRENHDYKKKIFDDLVVWFYDEHIYFLTKYDMNYYEKHGSPNNKNYGEFMMYNVTEKNIDMWIRVKISYQYDAGNIECDKSIQNSLIYA